MSQSVEKPKEQTKGQTVRVIGQIMKVGEIEVSKAGNPMQMLSVVVNDGINKDGVWWNMRLMGKVRDALVEAGAGGLLEKFRYAKFIGLGSQRPWTDKTGAARVSNDMLISSIELQDGTTVPAPKARDENADEDAPF